MRGDDVILRGEWVHEQVWGGGDAVIYRAKVRGDDVILGGEWVHE